MLLRKPIPNVNLFSGKDSEFRANIIYFLAINGESTTWNISEFYSKEEIRTEPSRKSMIVKSHLGGVYRNIQEKMLPEKYVMQIGTKLSKGNNIPTYGLAFRGSLAVLSLDLKQDDTKKIIEKNSNVNPFYRLISNLENNGVKYDLCDQVILKGLVNGVKNNLINLASNNESIFGQSVIPALAAHFSSIDKTELRKFRNILDKIWDKKFPDNLGNFLNGLSSTMINPLFWPMWRNNEDAQLITLYSLIDVTLNPKKYEMTGLAKMSKPKYDKRFDNLKIDV